MEYIKELPKLYTVLYKKPRNKKLFINYIHTSDYRDYLSFQKYNCANHHTEFYNYTNEFGGSQELMKLALIVNGYPYKISKVRYPRIEINAHFTTFCNNMYNDCLHTKICNCKNYQTYPQLV